MRDPLQKRSAQAREKILAVLEDARAHGLQADLLQEAADLLFEDPPGDHYLRIEEEGWAVEHPTKCFETGNPEEDCLIEAHLRDWLELESEPPLYSGIYHVEYDSNTGQIKIAAKN